MGHSKLTRVPREVALCAAPASTGGFDSSTEHAVLAILVGLLVSVGIWMFRRWPSRPAPQPAAAEQAPSNREPTTVVSPRPQPAAAS